MLRTSLALLLLAAPPKAVSTVGYAKATGWAKRASRPALYQPLNLLDARESTAWCTATSDALNDTLTFGFKGPVTLDEVRISTGNGASDKTFAEFSRAKKLALKSAHGSATLQLEDRRGPQPVKLDPPLEGTVFTLEVLEPWTSDELDAPVCLSDVVFYAGGKPLNGSWMSQKLAWEPKRAAVLGTWYAGAPGEADRSLSLFFDGTWRLSVEPFDQPKKAHALTGTYEASTYAVTLGVSGKGKAVGRIRKDKDSARTSLVFEAGSVPELKQPFRDKN